MVKAIVSLMLFASTLSVAEDKPLRIDSDVANQNLIKKVEPTVPPLARSIGIGGTVVADIVITPEGNVSSVKLISGHPMLAPAFIEAVRKWEYKPFLKDGNASFVVTRVDWSVDTPEYSPSQEKALKDYYPTFNGCYQLVSQGKDAEAEKKCREAVALADQLPEKRILERSDARSFLGHSLFRQQKVNEAIRFYEKALEIRKNYENSDRDADFASENANLARAYAAVAQIEKADFFYSQAVTIFKAAIVELPDMKQNYSGRLKAALLEYSKLKLARGERGESTRLEGEAAQIGLR